MTSHRLYLDDVHSLTLDCLSQNGFDDENATAIADRILQAERDMCHSHGLFRLPLYVSGVQTGRVNGKARPKIKQLGKGVIQTNGDNGYAPLSQMKAHSELVGATRDVGIAAMAINNVYHIAALWPEIEALVGEDLCVIAMTASYPFVAPAGGTSALFGTNPIGFGWPRAGQLPLIFDQACSAMARGELQIAARDHRSVPITAGIGPNGEETTDPDVVLRGAQLAFGGAKGASLAMMVELMAGPLIGDFLSFEALEDDQGKWGPPKGGELIVAIDPTQFGDAKGFQKHGEKLFEAILKQDGTRLPSSRRYEARKKTAKDGITIPKNLYNEILGLLGNS